MGDKPFRAAGANEKSPVEIPALGGVASPDAITLPGIGPGGGGRDEGSVPPMGDLDSRFFEMAADPIESVDSEPRRPLRRLHGADVHRRERFVRFVAGAVAVSAVLCGAALVKTAVAPVAPAVAPVAPVARAAAGKLTLPAPAEVPSPAAPSREASPVAESSPASAMEERGASRDALEHGQIALSIEAGERSVALDPTDAEAWLVLGAAYQERGQLTEARRCYKACLARATWGPRTECRELLRYGPWN